MAMKDYNGWEVIRPLGSGGQSDVFLVRSAERQRARNAALRSMSALLPGPANISIPVFGPEAASDFANAIAEYNRPDVPSELGALKVFKLREGGDTDSEKQALNRLLREIEVLRKNLPGLLTLLASNEKERWIITQYYAEGTIEGNPFKYQGKPVLALKAFRSLVASVALLHKDGIVHRDIKPANVFFGKDNSLILGDFGIVFLPDRATRLTVTNEKVGPRDYMPQWGDLGIRLEEVNTNFDVYMLGKLLWCMVAGRLRLPREYYRRKEFDLEEMFKEDSRMKSINSILDKCVVEEPEDALQSAHELLLLVDDTLQRFKQRDTSMIDEAGKLNLTCRMCGKGIYQPRSEILHVPVPGGHSTLLRMYCCNVCTHFEFFAPGNPEEAARRGWTR